MSLIDTPMSNQTSPQGRFSITIGKIAVEPRAHKAQQCHRTGTEVIAWSSQKRQTPDSVSLGIFHFRSPSSGWNDHRRQTAFRG